MLKSLDMICSNRWNKVTQRDNQDALDFIEILFGKHESFNSTENDTMQEVQHANSILMAIFKSLIKAVLLLQESDAEYETLLKENLKCADSSSRQFVIDKLGDVEYRMWLADKFFIFYLNRSKQYQCNGRSNI